VFSTVSHRYQVFLVCATGIFFTVFDTSSAIVALPTIAIQFGTDLPTAQWVIIGNSLTIAALLIPMGRLSDLIGRKRIYVLGCLLFGLGSLIAAAAGTMLGLIASRALVGVGSAMTQGTAMAILVGNFDHDERARMLGLQMAGVGLGAMAGPALGGLIVGAIGWRALFVVTALAMAVVGFAAQAVLKRRKKIPELKQPAFDLAGAILFSSLLATGLLGLTLGPRTGWLEPSTLGGLALFLLLAIAFVVVERRHPTPMLDFGLFARPAVAVGALSAVVAFMCISAMRFLTPFFLQGIKGFAPTKVGLLMLPAAMVTATTAPFIGRLADRYGVRLLADIGFCIAAAGVALYAPISPSTPTWVIVASLIVMGLGMASFGAPNSASILNAVDADTHGVAAGVVNLCRNTGNIIGIAFGTAVVTLTMTGRGYSAALEGVGTSAEAGLLTAFTDGMQTAAISLLCLVLPVLAIVLFVSRRLRSPAAAGQDR
jgi:EmrB/QacA subfamily drug resistance transporter